MDINSYINNDIIFNSKAAAVPYNYRISYKIALITAIIGKCCGKKGCSAIKLQMINALYYQIDEKTLIEIHNLCEKEVKNINGVFSIEDMIKRKN